MTDKKIYQNLILYKNFDKEMLLVALFDKDISKALGILLEFASKYALSGNLIHTYLLFHILNDDNIYARATERREFVNKDLEDLALLDFKLLKDIFDNGEYEIILEDKYKFIKNYQLGIDARVYLDAELKKEIEELSISLCFVNNEVEFKNKIKNFYQKYGCGNFAFNRAFAIKEAYKDISIQAISNVDKIRFSDIVGLEFQKKELIKNTKAFLDGKSANNVLLFGDAGTGKSSSIKALVNEFYNKGLRIIEIYKQDFILLPALLEKLKVRNYKFIIYMDDLSFEDNEVEYKYLKAILEGGLGAKPENVLIYATSNRRHLIRESFKDKLDVDNELHRRDTVQEKISLAARFGLNIYFSSPDKKEYDIIVKELSKKADISIEEKELLALANIWEMQKGGRSGRSASQFVNSLQTRIYEV